MPCGKIQIQKNIDGVAFNDNFINIKPEISLFKTVYRRHTNFASENVYVYFNQESEILYDSSATFSCKIDNIGHILNDVYLVLDMPNILNIDNIAAISDLGIHIIEYVSLNIGGYVIHEYDNDWINIYYKRLLEWEKYKSVFTLINPDRSYSPKFAYEAQKLYVWLPFNFSRDKSLGLPLLNCMYDDIYITVRIRPLKYWFTILNSSGLRIGITNIEQYIHNNSKFKLFMNVNVSYFDKDELKKIEKSSREFFIEQTYIINYTNVSTKTINIPILSKQIVKEFYVIAQRDDNETRNVFGNYSNYENNLSHSGNYNENLPYVFSEYYDSSYIYDLYEHYNNEFNPEIVENIQLYLNGQQRYATVNSRFLRLVYSYIQNLNYQNMAGDYIYYYSFSNNTHEYNPNGALTLDRIKDANLVIYLHKPPPIKSQSNRTMLYNVRDVLKGRRAIQTINMNNDSNQNLLYNYNIKVYITNYNIIKFKGGMTKLVWV
jgi:hypothetical protein